MKKEKAQSATKAAKKPVQESLVSALKTIAEKLYKDGIETVVDIEKEAKKLAKKMFKGAKSLTTATPEPGKESPAQTKAKKPVKIGAPSKAKLAVVKTKTTAAPAATPEPAASAPVVVKTTAAKKPAKK